VVAAALCMVVVGSSSCSDFDRQPLLAPAQHGMGDDDVQEGTEEDLEHIESNKHVNGYGLVLDATGGFAEAPYVHAHVDVWTDAERVLHFVPRVRHNVLYTVYVNNVGNSQMISGTESSFFDLGYLVY
jgi:hypothetical protein